VRLRRRIEWIDTDAAGIYHWTTAFRLAEAAEGALYTALGIEQITFGAGGRLQLADEIIHHEVSEDARKRIDLWAG
jgi:acyl-CoA thioester hydrolase